MVNPNRFYTYAYLREDRSPYYIGKGIGNRIYQKHQKGISTPKNKSRIIFLKQNLTEEEAFKHEIYMIIVFGRKDLGTGILYNKTDGGEGHSNPSPETIQKRISKLKGKKHSEETKKKISNSNKGKSNFWLQGVPRTEETKKKISQATKGILRSKKTKQNISNALKGKPKSKDTRKKLQKIMEKRYSHIYYEIIKPNGIVEYVFNSLKSYSKENRLHSGQMYKVANGKINQHKGYKVKRYIKNEVL